MLFSQKLLEWYAPDVRALPWRGERDPYRIWLSEIMLQQTQAVTVKGYYARFLEAFPDVYHLAEASEDHVLKLWEGLGYYSRARNLHKAAQTVAYQLGGRFPENAEGLRALAGIGPYAANAIASIAYNECAPALDGNQARVLTRYLAYEPVVKTPFDLLDPAMALISRDRPGDYNQALMDLGATVCTPSKPACDGCPVRTDCRAHALLRETDFPNKPKPLEKKSEDWSIVLVCSPRGEIAVHRRGKGMLSGLYEFSALEGHPEGDALIGALKAKGCSSIRIVEQLPDSKHVFTHKIWHMRGWRVTSRTLPEGMEWVYPAALDSLAFPSALRVYTAAARGGI